MKLLRKSWFVLACGALVAALGDAALTHAAPDTSDPLAGLEWRNIGPFRGGRVTAVTGVVGPAQRLLLRRHRRRHLEEHRQRRHLDQRLRRPARHRLGRRDRGRAVRPQRGLRRHGRGLHPRQRVARRRRLQVGRRRAHVEARRACATRGRSAASASIRAIPTSSTSPRSATRSGPTTSAACSARATAARPGSGCCSSNDSTGAVDLCMDPQQPARALRHHLAGAPHAVEPGERRRGQRAVEVDRRRRHLDAPHRRGTAQGAVGPHRRHGLAAPTRPRVGDDRGRRRRRLPLRRRRPHVAARQRGAQPAPARLVLHAHLRRPQERRRGVRAQRRSSCARATAAARSAPIAHAARRQPRPVDRSRRPAAHDRGQRRRRQRHASTAGCRGRAQDNQPTAQFYHVDHRRRVPVQASTARSRTTARSAIASRTDGVGIGRTDWYDVGGGESGYIAPKPGDPEIVYAGSYDGYLTRYDHRTGQERNVNPYPDNPMGWGAEGAKYRFQWTFPIVVSPHDPNTVYAGSNVLHRSTNEGQSWEVISPDLTRNDPDEARARRADRSPRTTPASSTTARSSRWPSRSVAKGVLWVGSDDGLVHVSRDGGKTLAERDAAGAAGVEHDQPDRSRRRTTPAPRTSRRTATSSTTTGPTRTSRTTTARRWRSIAGDLPLDGGFVRVVREDPVRKGLLFCGTETGLYLSLDGGARWRPLRLNRPGTDRRPRRSPTARCAARCRWCRSPTWSSRTTTSWSPRRAARSGSSTTSRRCGSSRRSRRSATHWLFTPSPASLFGGAGRPRHAGANPPYGAVVYYRLAREPKEKEEVTLEFLDAHGQADPQVHEQGAIRRRAAAGGRRRRGGFGRPRGARKIPAKAGLNRFAWDLRYPDATPLQGHDPVGRRHCTGPTVVPGDVPGAAHRRRQVADAALRGAQGSAARDHARRLPEALRPAPEDPRQAHRDARGDHADPRRARPGEGRRRAGEDRRRQGHDDRRGRARR